jgi:hypothetical protein
MARIAVIAVAMTAYVAGKAMSAAGAGTGNINGG